MVISIIGTLYLDIFNSKDYLRDLATKIQSSDNAAEVLATALQKIQPRSKKINVKKDTKEKLTEKSRPEKL